MSIVAHESHQVPGRVGPNTFDSEDLLVEFVFLERKPTAEVHVSAGNASRQLEQIGTSITGPDFANQKLFASPSKLFGAGKVGVFVVKTGPQLVYQVLNHSFCGAPGAVRRANHLDKVFKQLRTA